MDDSFLLFQAEVGRCFSFGTKCSRIGERRDVSKSLYFIHTCFHWDWILFRHRRVVSMDKAKKTRQEWPFQKCTSNGCLDRSSISREFSMSFLFKLIVDFCYFMNFIRSSPRIGSSNLALVSFLIEFPFRRDWIFSTINANVMGSMLEKDW